MKIKETITKWQLECRKYTSRFTKSWEYACLSGDAFIAGYQCALKDGMNEVVEVEREDGEHQLSPRTFNLWHSRLSNENFQSAMIEQMNYWNFKDLRASVDINGVVSFQGTAIRNLNTKIFSETTS